MSQISVTVNGVTFNVFNQKNDSDKTMDNIVRGLWEPQTFKIISNLLDNTDCALEIGIDGAQTTMFTASVVGKLIAVEPSLDSINLAKKYIEINSHLQNKVTLVHGALSNSREKVFFWERLPFI